MSDWRDDDSNVICLGGRVIGLTLAWDLVQMFLSTHFKGNELFTRRLEKAAALERKEKA